jgi:hypothetical protein
MDFLRNLRASIYGPEYYKSLGEEPFSYSLKYFFVLIAWLAVISAAVFLVSAIPAVNSFLRTTSAQIVQYYPSGLQITVASGSVSANVPQPYFLALPPSIAANLSSSSHGGVVSSSLPENLLVIDTKDPITVDEFEKDNTVALLASDSLAYAKNGSMVVQPIGSGVSFVVNKASATAFVEKAEPYFAWVDWVIGILMPIGIFAALACRLVYLFILALLVWGLARVSGVGVGYMKAYQWGLHLMTLPFIVGIASWLILPGVNIPFLFTILALLAAAINLRHAPARATTISPPSSSA